MNEKGSKLSEIRALVAKFPNDWKLKGFGGEHDETGGYIRDAVTDERIAVTASHEGGWGDQDWTTYHAKANLIAHAPQYMRYLLGLIDTLSSNRNLTIFEEPDLTGKGDL